MPAMPNFVSGLRSGNLARLMMALAVTVMMAGITGPAAAASESERDAFRQAFSDAVSDPAMMQAVTQIADLGPEKTFNMLLKRFKGLLNVFENPLMCLSKMF